MRVYFACTMKLSEFIPKLRICARSADIEVRKLAARAIMSFVISPEDKKNLALSIVEEFLSLDFDRTSLNYVHGCLIQV
jgi:hypothetical protein